MKVSSVVALCLLAFVGTVVADNWVVLVAGSNGYWNYRHGSDIGHAYQIAKKGGIPADRIITMVYNDAANSSQNPFRGQIFNKPTDAGVPGVNVFENIQIDYQGNSVTAQNFLNVISGNAAGVTGGNGKVVKSSSKDNIFIYFSDHGSVGSIAFPAGSALQVSALQNTLKSMASGKKFDKLVFYLEACESGSMFEGWLPNNLRIYATTAANAHESSWGWYCSPNDKVNGKAIGSCLGDEYSITWLESVDTLGFGQTLQANFEYVRDHTKKSHVMQYGDLSFKNDKLSDFLTEKGKAPKLTVLPRHPNFDKPRPTPAHEKTDDAKDSRDIKFHYLAHHYTKKGASLEDRLSYGKELIKEIQHRMDEDVKYTTFASRILGVNGASSVHTAPLARPAAECGKCCEAAFDVVYSKCGGFSDYSLKYGRTIYNVCMSGPDMTEKVVATLASVC